MLYEILMMLAQAGLAALFTLIGVALYMRRSAGKIDDRINDAINTSFEKVGEGMKDLDLSKLMTPPEDGEGGEPLDIKAIAAKAGIELPDNFDPSQLGDIAKKFGIGGSNPPGGGEGNPLDMITGLLGGKSGGKGGGIGDIIEMISQFGSMMPQSTGSPPPIYADKRGAGHKGFKKREA